MSREHIMKNILCGEYRCGIVVWSVGILGTSTCTVCAERGEVTDEEKT